VDLSRRGALAAVAAGVAAYPFFSIRPGGLMAKGDPLIRPPLANKEPDGFLQECLRCGQCMRACPTRAIQPAGLEAGIEGTWTPKLVPRLGYCIYECDSCGRACPSGAIPAFTLKEKQSTAIGLAYFDQGRCIPWRGWEHRTEEGWVADKYNCGVCEEVCPVPGKAIRYRVEHPQGQELRLPYVVDDACTGCGFCEFACPVVGQAGVRITGGFRELPPPAQPPPAASETETALPATAGNLRLSGPKKTYTGVAELRNYIDGEADRYVPFGFVRVTAATYTDGTSQVSADLWQFADADGAFGAYAKDRQGKPVAVGDEGSQLNGSVWARRGRFTVRVINMGRAQPQSTLKLAQEAIHALEEPAAARPAICRRLPKEGLREGSVLYMRDEAPLWDLDLAEQYFPQGVFDITGGAVAAYGTYSLRSDSKPAALLLVRYPDEKKAADAATRIAAARTGWGEQEVAKGPYQVFKAAEGSYGAVGARGPLLAAAFYMPTAEAAVKLLAGALK
jgi:NAD-dependent dihydropyrimidine dehydrogenase PreA subunit